MSEESLKSLLLSASDREFDPIAKRCVEMWGDEPTPVQLLEVIDKCIFGSLCGGFILTVLQLTYKAECDRTGVAHEDVVKQATWWEAM